MGSVNGEYHVDEVPGPYGGYNYNIVVGRPGAWILAGTVWANCPDARELAYRVCEFLNKPLPQARPPCHTKPSISTTSGPQDRDAAARDAGFRRRITWSGRPVEDDS